MPVPPVGAGAGHTLCVDTPLHPPYDLVAGARACADATCSSVVQQPLDFTRALGAYTG
ncbi:hypothetical protein [Kitasatospora sp. NPDC001225]